MPTECFMMLLRVTWYHMLSEDEWKCVEGARHRLLGGLPWLPAPGAVTSHTIIITALPEAPYVSCGAS